MDSLYIALIPIVVPIGGYEGMPKWGLWILLGLHLAALGAAMG